MNRLNDLLNHEYFDIELFSRFIEKKDISKLNQKELDRIVKKFGMVPFDYIEFSNVYELTINNSKNYITKCCLMILIISLIISAAILHMFIYQICYYLILL